MQIARYTRLWADDAGESHFEEVEVGLDPINFAPPAPPLNVKRISAATGVSFVGGDTTWGGDVRHPSPHRQFMCTITGSYAVTASDGSRREFPPGSLLLLEDTHGAGHSTQLLSELVVVSIALE